MSLNAAHRPKQWSVKILVAANACNDGTHDFLDNYHRQANSQDWLPLKWIAEPKPGKSYALNSAIPRVASSDIVAFVDDDQRADSCYLKEICSAADTHPDITMFCGRLLPDWDGTEPEWVHDNGRYKIRPLPVPRSDGGPEVKELTLDDPTPPGGNLFMRGSIFNRVGSFSTALGPRGHNLGGGEDSVFIRSALAAGERLMYIPAVVQYHYVDPKRLKFNYILRKAFHRSRSVAASSTHADRVPLYIWRKIIVYVLYALFSLGRMRRRHYLVRTATILGECAGLLQASYQNPDGQERKRTAIYLVAIGISLTGAIATSVLANLHQALTAASAILIISGLFTLTLCTKSLIHFSFTGPRLQKEIFKRYRVYALQCFVRLAAYAFSIFMLLAAPGALNYEVAMHIMEGKPYMLGYLLSATASVALLLILQFSRHLLWLPANITASSNYRVSRLYSYWRKLTPARLRVATIIIVGVPGSILISSAIAFLAKGQPLLASALIFVVLFYSSLALWLRNPEPRPTTGDLSKKMPNIVMIGSDTLRADRLDGRYDRDVAPYMRSLVQRGTLLNQCYVPCARTAPSLISLLTGTWPHHHGVRDNFVSDTQTILKVDALPRILSCHGYYTAAVSDWCGADMGKFNFGFDYVDLPEDQWNIKYFIRQGPKDLRMLLSLFARNRFGKQFLPEIYYLGGVPLTDELGKDARRLINQLSTRAQPFLLNIFYSTTHGPFGSEYPYYTRFAKKDYDGESKFVMARLTDPWEIIRRQAEPREAFDLDQIINLYDGCVARFDDEVRRMITHLEQCGLSENTIVVIYSDHGMEFFENATWGQGNSVISDASSHIPLLISAPGLHKGRSIAQPVRNIDLTPTLLDLVGIDPDSGMDGISLKPYMMEPRSEPKLDVYGETGLWLTDLPGTPEGHLRYPDLLDLLTVRNIMTGTISIKPEYEEAVILAKDRVIRSGRWKLVYQPLMDSYLLKLFDTTADPACLHDVSASHPELTQSLWRRLEAWISSDPLIGTKRKDRLLAKESSASYVSGKPHQQL